MSFDQEYKFSKIDAFSQFHVVRRLAPIIGDLAAVIVNSGAISKDKKSESISIEDIDFDKLAKELGPVMTALSKISDEDFNYCIHTLLKSVERKVPGGGWAPVVVQNNVIMFQDIKENLYLLLTLAGKAIVTNLSGFFQALPSGLKEGALNSMSNG